jgi:ornithine cyclodeaminase/alanine dehydrogenase-like protein (mu-crystallin family)
VTDPGNRMAGGGHPFAGRATRVLGMAEVRRLLSMEDTIDIQRDAFTALARGETVAAPNAWLRLPPERGGWLKLLAGYDGSSGGLGVKVLARFPHNPPGANLGSLIVLFDPDDGFPRAIMDGVYITALRTGAGAGLATAALARPDATSVGLVGSGVVAWHSLQAIRIACPGVASVRVYSRSDRRRAELVARIERELGLEAAPAASTAEAVGGAAIVITATNSPEPILDEADLAPGQHVNAMGIRTELAPAAVAACRVIGDGREETLGDGKFSVALVAGAVTEGDLGPDLGEVLAGHAPGRTDAAQVTMFDSSGVALQDVACALAVWERAERDDAGVLVDVAGGDVLAGAEATR